MAVVLVGGGGGKLWLCVRACSLRRIFSSFLRLGVSAPGLRIAWGYAQCRLDRAEARRRFD